MRTYFVYGRVHGEEKKRKERRGIQWESLWELGTGTGRTPIMTITGTTLCVSVPSWAMRLGSMRMHNTQSLQVATPSLELPVHDEEFGGKILHGMFSLAFTALASVSCSLIARVCVLLSSWTPSVLRWSEKEEATLLIVQGLM